MNEWKNEWMSQVTHTHRRCLPPCKWRHRRVTSHLKGSECAAESLTSTIFVAQVRESPDVPQTHGEPHTGHDEVHLSGPGLSLRVALPLLHRRYGSSGRWYGSPVEGPIDALMRVSIGNEMALLLLHQDHVQGAVCVQRGFLHLSCKQRKSTSSRDSTRA